MKHTLFLVTNIPSPIVFALSPFDSQDRIEAGYDIKLDRDRI